MRQYAARWRNLLVAGEALTLFGSVYAAIFLRYIVNDNPLHAYAGHWSIVLRASVFTLAIMLGLTAMGLHHAHLRESWFGILARQIVGFVLGWVGLVILYYLVPSLHIGRGLLLIAFVVSFVLLGVVRWIFNGMTDLSVLKQGVVVLSAGKRAAIIPQRMRRRADRMGFKLIGFLAQPGEDVMVPRDQVLAPGCDLDQWAIQQGVEEIVVALDDRRGSLPMDALLSCRQHRIDVTDLTSFIERESGRLQLNQTDPSWLIFSDGFNASSWRQVNKRGFDIVIAVLLLVPSLPLMILTAMAIMLEPRPGWSFRHQGCC